MILKFWPWWPRKQPLKPQQPRRLPGGFCFRLHFWNQWLPLIKMSYRLFYLENFHFSNFQHPVSRAAIKFEKWKWQNALLCSVPNSFSVKSINQLNAHTPMYGAATLPPAARWLVFLLSFSPFSVAGIFFVLPCIETYQGVDLRTITLDVPPQEVT